MASAVHIGGVSRGPYRWTSCDEVEPAVPTRSAREQQPIALSAGAVRD